MGEYFSRWTQVKRIVEKDEVLCQRIRESFFESNSNAGKGTRHVVRRVGAISFKDRQLPLVLRFDFTHPENDLSIKVGISEYGRAFSEGLNPPYVAGVVKFRDSRSIYFGILLEDVTECGSYTLSKLRGRMGLASPFEIRSDGRIFFLDPDDFANTNEEVAQRYFEAGLNLV